MKKVFFTLYPLLALFAIEEPKVEWKPPTLPPVQEFNSYLQQALSEHNWWASLDYANIIFSYYPSSPFAEEAPFIMGESYFKLNELELANDCFTYYLTDSVSPKHFEEAIYYKFTIAERFRRGEKKPLFGSHKMPKILPAKEDALKIYDEVIATLPHSEIAAQSLLGKAKIQIWLEDFKPSLETLDLLIRRFPKHDLAVEAYLEKNHVYLLQCQLESPDPDLLDLAEVNLRKFRLAFPREPRLAGAREAIVKMQEVFAKNLLEIGAFFEKTKKIPASIIYYSRVIAKYPNTEAARLAREKLDDLPSA